MDEKIDVLNELGEFTGKVATLQECHSQGYWHRAVYAFIVDKDFIQRGLVLVRMGIFDCLCDLFFCSIIAQIHCTAATAARYAICCKLVQIAFDLCVWQR